MAGNLLWREDWLFDAGQRRDFTQLGQLHILESLRIFSQANMAHAPLDVVDKPAFAKHRNNRDALAGNVSSVFQHPAARHNVLAHFLALYPFLAYLAASNCGQCFL